MKSFTHWSLSTLQSPTHFKISQFLVVHFDMNITTFEIYNDVTVHLY